MIQLTQLLSLTVRRNWLQLLLASWAHVDVDGVTLKIPSRFFISLSKFCLHFRLPARSSFDCSRPDSCFRITCFLLRIDMLLYSLGSLKMDNGLLLSLNETSWVLDWSWSFLISSVRLQDFSALVRRLTKVKIITQRIGFSGYRLNGTHVSKSELQEFVSNLTPSVGKRDSIPWFLRLRNHWTWTI